MFSSYKSFPTNVNICNKITHFSRSFTLVSRYNSWANDLKLFESVLIFKLFLLSKIIYENPSSWFSKTEFHLTELVDSPGFPYLAKFDQNLDDGINTGSAAGIRGVPTVIIYKKGVEIDRKVGGVPESHMKEFLEKNI